MVIANKVIKNILENYQQNVLSLLRQSVTIFNIENNFLFFHPEINIRFSTHLARHLIGIIAYMTGNKAEVHALFMPCKKVGAII